MVVTETILPIRGGQNSILSNSSWEKMRIKGPSQAGKARRERCVCRKRNGRVGESARTHRHDPGAVKHGHPEEERKPGGG